VGPSIRRQRGSVGEILRRARWGIIRAEVTARGSSYGDQYLAEALFLFFQARFSTEI
jgi:hypothetical protein